MRGGEGRVAGSQPKSTVVLGSPNKLRRSNSILTYKTEKGAQNLSNMPRNALAGNFLEAYSFSIVFSIGFSL